MAAVATAHPVKIRMKVPMSSATAEPSMFEASIWLPYKPCVCPPVDPRPEPRPEARPEQRPVPRPAPRPGPPPSHPGTRVLLAEDEALVAMALADCLEAEGHTVTVEVTRLA